MLMRLRKLLLQTALLFIGLFVGFGCGLYWEHQATLRIYADIWSGIIEQNVGIVRLLNAGETERAVERLELPLENCVLQLAYAPYQKGLDVNIFKAHLDDYSGIEMRGIQLAKMHQLTSTTWKPGTDTLALLKVVPELTGKACRIKPKGKVEKSTPDIKP